MQLRNRQRKKLRCFSLFDYDHNYHNYYESEKSLLAIVVVITIDIEESCL